MDDFGSSLERDYGLRGRKGRNRSGGSGSGSSRKRTSNLATGYLNFSESFGRSGGGGGYGGGREVASSYSVYDEIFSTNLHSTIPVFEDVFRVGSGRMKVSELRDNDVFRGMMSLKRSSSRVTYEDIFGDSPDQLSGPFLFGEAAPGSRLTLSSQPSSSGGQSPATAPPPQHVGSSGREASTSSPSPTPRQEAAGSSRTHSESPRQRAPGGSRTHSESPTPRRDAPGADVESPARRKENFESSTTHSDSPTPPRKDLLADVSAAQRPVELRNGHLHAALKTGNVQGSFLGALKLAEDQNVESRSESLRSRGEDVTPHANGENSAAQSPAADKAWLSVGEVSLTTKPSENPPPVRLPPGQASTSSRHSTEGPLPEPPQLHSGPPPLRVPPSLLATDGPTTTSSELLARVLKERSGHAEMSIREKVLDWHKHNLTHEQAEEDKQDDTEHVNSTSSSFHKLQPEQDNEAEKTSAEAELTATLRTDQLQEDDNDSLEKKQELPEAETQTEPEATGSVREPETTITQAAANDEPDTSYVERAAETDTTNVQTSSDGESRVAEQPEAADGKGNTLPQVQTVGVSRKSTDSESTIGIDTISSTSEESTVETTPGSGTAAKEGPAPETPERLEPAHIRHDKKSDVETRALAASVAAQHQPDEAQVQRERTLVARITAEVKERAALDVRTKAEVRRTKPRLKVREMSGEEVGSSARGVVAARVSLREQLEMERLARLAGEKTSRRKGTKEGYGTSKVSEQPFGDAEAARLRAERTLAERLNNELRERAARAAQEAKAERKRQERERLERERAEREKLDRERLEKERLERLDKARERERERLEKLARERELEQQRLERELELEREIERKKDRVGLEEKLEAEAAAARSKMERVAVERTTAEVRARAYERAAAAAAAASSRPSSVPKQRFGNSASMPTTTGTTGYAQPDTGMRRATSSTNLNSSRYSSSGSFDSSQQEFQELKGETPERRKARLERFQRTQNRAVQALAQKNKRDLEVQSEQAERQRVSERLDTEIRRWSVGKDGNIRALLSTLQYVLWAESGWKQVSLTELISIDAVKKAYRRAILCVHPDKMQQKHASVQQKYIAEKVFHILQMAWNKFKSQEAL